MPSKIIGLTVLTNPRTVDAGQRVVYVDANFWLAEGVQVLGCLRYFNKAPRIEFDPEDAIPCVIEASVSFQHHRSSLL